jgi:hypothetical protein
VLSDLYLELNHYRVHEDNDFSLIHKRYIEEDAASGEPTLVLVKNVCPISLILAGR